MSLSSADRAVAREILEELIHSVVAKDGRSAKLVADLRNAMEMTLQQFGAKIGADARTVRRWETPNSSEPAAGKLRTWSSILGLVDHGDATSTESEILPVIG